MNFKNIFVTGLALCFSFSVVAQEQLVKVLDGTVAYCKSQDDVARYLTSGVVSLKLNKVKDLGDRLALNVSVNYYLCKKNDRGYGFEKMQDPSYLSYGLSDRRISIERRDFTLRVINGNYDILAKELVKNDSSGNETILTFEKAELTTLANGKKYVDIDLSAMFKFSDNRGTSGNFEPRVFGSYRVLF